LDIADKYVDEQPYQTKADNNNNTDSKTEMSSDDAHDAELSMQMNENCKFIMNVSKLKQRGLNTALQMQFQKLKIANQQIHVLFYLVSMNANHLWRMYIHR
jgi:hypothetical protein